MNKTKFVLNREYITLGQLLKAAGLVENGVEAKEVILGGAVSVNGETELRRGRKLYPGDTVIFEDAEITIAAQDEDRGEDPEKY